MSVGLLVASLLIGVAVFRVWRIIGKDQITEFVRVWLIQREGRISVFALDLIGCAWCLGFWLAGAATILIAIGRWTVLETLLVWAAASGIAGLLGEVDALLTHKSESSGL